MNHSKAFWKVRDGYAEHLKVLWGQNYHGEGLWGKGQSLLSGRYTNDSNPEAAPDVRSLCGGAYRGRGGKRKSGKEKPKLSYAERQQKRIRRKFGKHGEGNIVGEDLYAKERLEKGRQTSAKPKVASSKRGRELRAAAALARFDQAKTIVEEEPEIVTEDDSTESETDSGGDDDEPQLMDGYDNAVLDRKGHPLFKVCDDEDMGDEDVKRELEELQDLSTIPETQQAPTVKKTQSTSRQSKRPATELKKEPLTTKRSKPSTVAQPPAVSTRFSKPSTQTQTPKPSSKPINAPASHRPVSAIRSEVPQSCPVCSLTNEPGTATCVVCANVLDERRVGSTWRCANQECATSGYINAGDTGVCGICGRART